MLRPVHGAARFELVPDAAGAFSSAMLGLAREAFTSRRDGTSHDVHPRLLELVYRAVSHFEVPYVHVVSGHRDGSATSRHSQGRAVDMVLPGVRDRRLAAYLRRQGFVGVGFYPTSGFVHLDVRGRSYFWLDRSGPGQRNRERAMLRRETYRQDARARRRGEIPIADVEVGHSGEGDGGEASAPP